MSLFSYHIQNICNRRNKYSRADLLLHRQALTLVIWGRWVSGCWRSDKSLLLWPLKHCTIACIAVLLSHNAQLLYIAAVR